MQLDRDFRALLHDKKTLRIEGREVLEHKFVIRSMLLAPAGRWGCGGGVRFAVLRTAQMIAESDHHSVVKPRNADDPVHKVRVFCGRLPPLARPAAAVVAGAASAEADRAIEANPKDAFAYTEHGEAYAQLEQLQNALEAFHTALKLYPDTLRALQGRGSFYAKMKKFDEALEDIDAARSGYLLRNRPYLMPVMFRRSAAEQETDRTAPADAPTKRRNRQL